MSQGSIRCLDAHWEKIVLDIKIVLCDENLSKPFFDTKVTGDWKKRIDSRKILFVVNFCAYRQTQNFLVVCVTSFEH